MCVHLLYAARVGGIESVKSSTVGLGSLLMVYYLFKKLELSTEIDYL